MDKTRKISPTGWALRLGFAGLAVPMVFAFRHGLLIIGSLPDILLAVLVVFAGVAAWAIAISGFLSRPLSITERTAFFAAGTLLFISAPLADTIGGVLIVAAYLWQRFHKAIALPRERLLISGSTNKR